MGSFKQWLRRPVGAKTWLQLAKFIAYKSAITVLSFKALQQLTLEFGPSARVILANSLVTQIVEFLVLGNRVFNGHPKSRETVMRQFVKFWVVVVVLGYLEGRLMEHYLRQDYVFMNAYVFAHIPTFLLRFLFDRYWVFRESLPGSL